MNGKQEWIDICALEDIPRQGGRVLRGANGNLAVFRSADDQVFALDDRCPHRQGPLSQGMVHGHVVTCPMHGISIDLATGQAVSPDTGCVRRYPLRVEAGRVLLQQTEAVAIPA